MTTAKNNARSASTTRGVVFVHACPSAIAPHVEWALAGVLDRPVRMTWSAQAAAPNHLRADVTWTGPVGTAAKLAAALRQWTMLVFEITEQGTPTTDGERLAYVPGRGFHRSMVAANGDVVVGEERLRGLAARAKSVEDFRHGLTELLGTAWDMDLDVYREAGAEGPVTLLHQVV